MKKQLLCLLSVALSASLSAQVNSNTTNHPEGLIAKRVMKASKFVQPEERISVPVAKLIPSVGNPLKMSSSAYQKISSSYNLNTATIESENCLNYNKVLNAVSFIHRQSKEWAWFGADYGNSQISWTTDNGATWDSLIYGIDHGTSNQYRFPSGCIYNPPGNTKIDSAFVVGGGILHDGALPWKGYYFNSEQLDSTFQDDQPMKYGAGPWPKYFYNVFDFDYMGNVVKTAGVICLDPSGTTSAAVGWRGMATATGTFDTVNRIFEWSFDTMNVVSEFATTSNNESYVGFDVHHAWSDDGQIGYRVFLGVDVTATTTGTRTYTPFVYKTTDGGTSWSVYSRLFDFSTIPAITSGLIKYDGVHTKPMFLSNNGFDLAVDHNGDLHIACQIASGSSNKQDSLDTYWLLPNKNLIYDVYTTSSGWNATIIDTIVANASDPVSPEAECPWTFSSGGGGLYGVDARLQVSKSPDGNKLFFVWADSDISGLTAPLNINPYLRAKGVDVDTRCWTPTKDITATLDFAWYHFASARCASPTSTTYQIPCTYVNGNPPGSYDGESQVDHFYVNDLTFSDTEFSLCNVGINTNNELSASVSIYPNPVNSSAILAVNLKSEEDVLLKLYSSIGQVVMAQKVKGYAGVNNINISAENLSPGIYFYEVRIGNSVVTNKMIIQK